MNSKTVSFLFLAIVTFVLAGCSGMTYRSQIGYGATPPEVAYAAGPQDQFGPVGVPRKDIAFLNFAPTCADSPLAIEFKNDSGNFVALQFDGLDVHIMGAYGELPPFVPPTGTIYLCFDRLGQHSVTGTQYRAGGQMVKLFDFSWNGELTRDRRHRGSFVSGDRGISM